MTQIKFRRGNCTSCGAMYKLPDSFSADKARCKECGGVVDVGPVETKTVAAAPGSPSRQPSKPGLSTAKAAAKSTARGTTGAMRPAPGARAAAAPVHETTGGPTRSTTPARSKGRAVDKGARTSGGRSSSAARRRGSSRRDSDERGDRKRDRNLALPIAALLGLVALGAGGWWFMNREEGATQAAEPDRPAEAGTNAADASDPKSPVAEPEEAAEPEEGGDTTGTTEAADEAPTDGDAVEADAAPADEASEDPESVDLSVWEDWPPLEGTTDEEWNQITAWVDDFSDPWAAASKFNTARDNLIANGRKAFPAILNKLKTLDLENEDQFRVADQMQRELLMRICNGRNYGWKYPGDKNYLVYDKKAIVGWMKAWDQAKESDIAWSNLSKIPLEEIQGQESSPEADELLEGIDDF